MLLVSVVFSRGREDKKNNLKPTLVPLFEPEFCEPNFNENSYKSNYMLLSLLSAEIFLLKIKK
jgi:hypothetical protein